jgi:small-conductance mechanosensitive channel
MLPTLYTRRTFHIVTVLGTVSIVLGVLLLLGLLLDGRTVFSLDAGPGWAGLVGGLVVLSLRRPASLESR